MKTISLKLIVIISVVFTFNLYAGQERYEIKSGIVQYGVETSGNVMGFSTSAKGKGTLYFKNWGKTELRKDEITQQSFGSSETEKTMTKLDKNILYSVDFDDKVIIKHDISKIKNNPEFMITDKSTFKENGAKKIGSEKILGYRCDIWEMQGQKIWLYKGIPLKIVAEVMGVKTIESATKAKFNVSIPNSNFNLPNFPIKNINAMISNQKSEQNTDQDNSMQNEDMMKEMQEQMQNLFKGFGN